MGGSFTKGLTLRGSGYLTFQKGCYSIAYLLLDVKRHFLASPQPTSPRLINSKKLVFSYYLQKKVIETTKKCDCDRKRLLKRLGCFKSLLLKDDKLLRHLNTPCFP